MVKTDLYNIWILVYKRHLWSHYCWQYVHKMYLLLTVCTQNVLFVDKMPIKGTCVESMYTKVTFMYFNWRYMHTICPFNVDRMYTACIDNTSSVQICPLHICWRFVHFVSTIAQYIVLFPSVYVDNRYVQTMCFCNSMTSFTSYDNHLTVERFPLISVQVMLLRSNWSRLCLISGPLLVRLIKSIKNLNQINWPIVARISLNKKDRPI